MCTQGVHVGWGPDWKEAGSVCQGRIKIRYCTLAMRQSMQVIYIPDNHACTRGMQVYLQLSVLVSKPGTARI